MEKLIKRITNGILIALATIAVVAGLMVAFKGGKGLDASLWIIYILLCVAILLIVFFAIAQILSSKKQIVSTLIMVGIFAVIVLVAYFIAPSELSEVAMRVGVSEGIYKWAGTALNIAYIAFFGVILAFIGSFVYLKIKK